MCINAYKSQVSLICVLIAALLKSCSLSLFSFFLSSVSCSVFMQSLRAYCALSFRVDTLVCFTYLS